MCTFRCQVKLEITLNSTPFPILFYYEIGFVWFVTTTGHACALAKGSYEIGIVVFFRCLSRFFKTQKLF